MNTPDKRPRGQRGAGRAHRRALQNVATDRQNAWLGKSRDGTTDTTTMPLRIRVAKLTKELDELYEEKRADN